MLFFFLFQIKSLEHRKFSVVETSENGGRCFSACPSTWINNNQLYWPPQSQLIKSRKFYEPPQAHWLTFDIINIPGKNIGMYLYFKQMKAKKIYIFQSFTDTLELALVEEKNCVNSSSEEGRREQKLFKRKHPALSLESMDDFNLNNQFLDLSGTNGRNDTQSLNTSNIVSSTPVKIRTNNSNDENGTEKPTTSNTVSSTPIQCRGGGGNVPKKTQKPSKTTSLKQRISSTPVHSRGANNLNKIQKPTTSKNLKQNVSCAPVHSRGGDQNITQIGSKMLTSEEDSSEDDSDFNAIVKKPSIKKIRLLSSSLEDTCDQNNNKSDSSLDSDIDKRCGNDLKRMDCYNGTKKLTKYLMFLFNVFYF